MSQPHELPSNEEQQDFITARMTSALPAATESLLHGQIASHVDWGEAPAVEQFFGREQERAILRQWMIGERCRIVAVLGIGGVGKTALATIAAEQAQESFEYIFWRSLQNAPPLEYFLQQCLSCFAVQWTTTHPLDDVHSQLNALMDSLRRHRCLLVLDNVESILQEGTGVGHYRPGYEGYGRLIQRIGEGKHQSCLLLTSREKPLEFARLESALLSVRALRLSGVEQEAGRQLLQDSGIYGSDEDWAKLIGHYSGNPLALKLVASSIQELFGGAIASFLSEGEAIFGSLSDLLDQQFQRLSERERELLYWLAIEREAVSLEQLRENMLQSGSKSRLVETLDALRRRSMIESASGVHGTQFTLQPVVMEYVSYELVERVSRELEKGELDLLTSHRLTKAQSKDYVRESQLRLLLAPLRERLYAAMHSKENIARRLSGLLALLREHATKVPGYEAANTLNLLIELGCDLRGYDFSHLSVRQTYLRGVQLPDVNFAHADLAGSVFTDIFGHILSLALSPNGELLAAGTASGEIRLWAASTGTPRMSYQGHTNRVRSLAFSSDGRILASGSDDRTIRIWDVATGTCLHTLSGHSQQVLSVAFHPDATTLVSGSYDRTIRLWNTSSGQEIQRIQGLHKGILAVAFRPDGRIFAGGGEDNTIQLWETETLQRLAILQGHTKSVWSVAFRSDGTQLVSGSTDSTVRVWDVATGICLHTLEGHSSPVWSVAFSPDGKKVASSSVDATVRLWDTRSEKCTHVLQEHTERVGAVIFRSDGHMLISGSADATIRFWDAETGQCVRTLQGYSSWIGPVACSPNSRVLASGGADAMVRLWEISTGRCLHTLSGHSKSITAVAFRPGGGLLASGSDDHTLRLWESGTQRCINTLRGHTKEVATAVFSPDGTLLASGSHDQTIRLWNAETGRHVRTLRGHTGGVESLAFHSDSVLLVSGSTDQTIRLWDIDTAHCISVLTGHSRRVSSVALDTDGTLIASGSYDTTVRLWDANTRELLRTLTGHTHPVHCVAFSPDSTLLASAGADRVVRLWDVATCTPLDTLQGHTDRIWSVAFSPDGMILASGSHDGSIKLWDVHMGTLLHTLRSERPYERMNIAHVRGLTSAQIAALKALGAVEDE